MEKVKECIIADVNNKEKFLYFNLFFSFAKIYYANESPKLYWVIDKGFESKEIANQILSVVKSRVGLTDDEVEKIENDIKNHFLSKRLN